MLSVAKLELQFLSTKDVTRTPGRYSNFRILRDLRRENVTSFLKLQASFLMARNVGRLHDPENTTKNVPANTLDVAYTGEHIHVQCLPLILYIAALGVKTIDYFSLDVEGNEIDVLETIPFNEVDIKACILIVS